MNWVDAIILGILGLSVLIGLMRGLVAELLSMVIWVAAFLVAAWFGPDVAALFENAISLSVARVSLGYAICFFGVLLIGAIVRFAARRLIWSTGLTGIDRLLGVGFGFVRGALVATMLVFLLGLTAITREPWWQQSVLLPPFQGTAAWLGQNIPASVGDHLHRDAVLDKLKSEPALQRQASAPDLSHASGLLDRVTPALLNQVHDLSGQLHDPMSARHPAPATPGATVAPAAAGSVSSQPRHP